MMSEVMVVGDTLVDFLPEGPGRLEDVERFTPRPGGSGANVAMAIAQLGSTPLFFTNLATDAFGQSLARTLSTAGVSMDLVHRDDAAQTTLALISATPDGEPDFHFYRDQGADTRLPIGAVSDDRLADTEWVHLTGVTLSAEPSRTATLELARRAGSHGCTLSFDPNVRETMWESLDTMTAVLRGTFNLVDIVISSAEELRTIGIDGDRPAGQARSVCSLGPHTAMLTRGREGAMVYGTEESPLPGEHFHPGFEVATVDTTGAGDAFCAAVVRALRGTTTDPERVLATANATAAVSTTAKGAVTALNDPDRIESLCGEFPWSGDAR